jgi:hypothetical protein
MMENNVKSVRKGVFLDGEGERGLVHTGQYADLGPEKPAYADAALLLSANRCFFRRGGWRQARKSLLLCMCEGINR